MGTKIEEDASGLGIKYKQAVYDMGTYAVERLTRVWLHADWLFQLSLLGLNQRKTLKTIREFPNKVINERKIYRDKFEDTVNVNATDYDFLLFNKKQRLAMLDLLLTAEKENKIDRNGIQEEVDTFMFEVTNVFNLRLYIYSNFLL